MTETVLLYNLSGTEAGRKLKPVLLRMKVRIRIVEPESYRLPIVELLTGQKPSPEAPGEGGAAPEALPEPMMVLGGFTNGRLDLLLSEMRKHNVPPIALKAVITAHNQSWDSLTLYEELKKEHEAMSQGS